MFDRERCIQLIYRRYIYEIQPLLKTDSPIKPEIQLSVYGQILESQKKTQ